VAINSKVVGLTPDEFYIFSFFRHFDIRQIGVAWDTLDPFQKQGQSVARNESAEVDKHFTQDTILKCFYENENERLVF
jgi:hypothetical protein